MLVEPLVGSLVGFWLVFGCFWLMFFFFSWGGVRRWLVFALFCLLLNQARPNHHVQASPINALEAQPHLLFNLQKKKQRQKERNTLNMFTVHRGLGWVPGNHAIERQECVRAPETLQVSLSTMFRKILKFDEFLLSFCCVFLDFLLSILERWCWFCDLL